MYKYIFILLYYIITALAKFLFLRASYGVQWDPVGSSGVQWVPGVYCNYFNFDLIYMIVFFCYWIFTIDSY